MSQQDNKATMRCVCAVIRTLMIDAEKESIVPRPQFNIFKDEYFVKLEKKHKEQNSQYDEASPEIFLCAADRKLPSLATIVTFFENTFSKSQMESECIIMSLIYIERLIDITKGRFCIRFDNWRSTSFACTFSCNSYFYSSSSILFLEVTFILCCCIVIDVRCISNSLYFIAPCLQA